MTYKKYNGEVLQLDIPLVNVEARHEHNLVRDVKEATVYSDCDYNKV